jgi:hypothetical protein
MSQWVPLRKRRDPASRSYSAVISPMPAWRRWEEHEVGVPSKGFSTGLAQSYGYGKYDACSSPR